MFVSSAFIIVYNPCSTKMKSTRTQRENLRNHYVSKQHCQRSLSAQELTEPFVNRRLEFWKNRLSNPSGDQGQRCSQYFFLNRIFYKKTFICLQRRMMAQFFFPHSLNQFGGKYRTYFYWFKEWMLTEKLPLVWKIPRDLYILGSMSWRASRGAEKCSTLDDLAISQQSLNSAAQICIKESHEPPSPPATAFRNAIRKVSSVSWD